MRTVPGWIVGFCCIAGLVGSAFFLLRSPAATSRLRVPPGFEIQQVAGAGLTSYPMMGTVDDRGRLFLCESSGNTQRTPEMMRNPDYVIRLLEDRDGDGVYDHASVFADKLTLPAGRSGIAAACMSPRRPTCFVSKIATTTA